MFKIITILTLFYALTSSAVPETENVGSDLNDLQQPLPLQYADTVSDDHHRDERHIKPCSRRNSAKEKKANDYDDETPLFMPPLFEPYLVKRLDESLQSESLNNEMNPASENQGAFEEDEGEALTRSHPGHQHVNSRVRVSEGDENAKDNSENRNHPENRNLQLAQDSNEQHSSRLNQNNENTNRKSTADAEDIQGDQNEESRNNQQRRPSSSQLVGKDQNNDENDDESAEKSSQDNSKGCRSHLNSAGTRRAGEGSAAESEKNAGVDEAESDKSAKELSYSPVQRSNDEDSQKAANANIPNYYNPNFQSYELPSNRLNSKFGFYGNQLADPAQGAGVSSLSSSGVNLLSHSRLCYACSSASNPTCLSPSRLTTVKYCRIGHDSCLTKTVQHGKNPVIVIRDCGSSCDASAVGGSEVKTCKICDSDLCNSESVSGAFSINGQSLMFTVFAISVVKYAM